MPAAAAAVAVVEGKAGPASVSSADAEAAINIANVMGVDPGTAEPLKSLNPCRAGQARRGQVHLQRRHDLRGHDRLYGGKRVCSVGCLGMGDCIRSCQFDAIHMGPEGFPVVDEFKCVGCGACEKACPKGLLSVKTMSSACWSSTRKTAPWRPASRPVRRRSIFPATSA
jgi:formate dehydrogenase beta subunit